MGRSRAEGALVADPAMETRSAGDDHHPEPPAPRRTLPVTPGRAVVPAMALGLGLYAVRHSPLPGVLPDTLSATLRRPYFVPGQGLFLEPAVNAAVVLIAVAATLAAAAVISRRFPGPRSERVLVFGLIAFAGLVVPAACLGGIAGWAGWSLLRLPTGPLLVSLPALAITCVAALRGWRPELPRLRLRARPGLAPVLSLVATFLLAVSAVLGFARPTTGFDALSYHAPMAVYFWRDGNIVSLLDRAPFGFAMALPGAAELWFGLLSSGWGERAANLGQLPFALLGAAAVTAFSRRLGFRPRGAAVAGLAFLIAPMVVIQAGVQMTDLAAAAILMSGIALAAAPADRITPFRAAMIGLASGLAVTVKLAVLPAAGGLMAYCAVAGVRARWPERRELGRAAIALVLAFGVAVAPWALRNAARFGNPVYPAALPLIEAGVVVGDFVKKDRQFVPVAWAWPLYPLVEAHSEESGLGPLFLVGAVPGLLAAMWRRKGRPLGVYWAVTLPSVVAWWMLTQHEPRHLFVVWGLAFAFVPWTLLVVPRGMRRAAAALLLAAAIGSALVTVDAALAPRLGEPVDRARFYDEVWGVDPALVASDTPRRLLYHTGYASLSYAGDYPLLGPLPGRLLLTVDGGVSTETIVRVMRQHGAEFAYVPASPRHQALVEARYPREVFELAHSSSVPSGKRKGTTRYLFRLKTPSPNRGAGRLEDRPQ